MQFVISETDEVLVPQAGLALVGTLLQSTALKKRAGAIGLEACPRPEVKHGDVLTAAIGLLCLGKSDFTDIEAFRSDEFFRRSLGLGRVPPAAERDGGLDLLGGKALAPRKSLGAGPVAEQPVAGRLATGLPTLLRHDAAAKRIGRRRRHPPNRRRVDERDPRRRR